MRRRLILTQAWIVALWLAIARAWKDAPVATTPKALPPPRRELSDQAKRLSCSDIENELCARLNWPR